ncbi:restriction endonuclease [Candidatus Kaiserbacteria bacterium]|nr:restriction endonuclease [Candidatus Kaiserbacteria bacterium]
MARKKRRYKKLSKNYTDEIIGFFIFGAGLLFIAKNFIPKALPWIYVIGLLGILIITVWFLFIALQRLKFKWSKEEGFRNIKNVAIADNMDDYQFEHFVAFLYQNQGYKTQVTQKGNDGGIDIVMEKLGKKIMVQVKHNAIGNKIGRVDLQKFVGAYSHVVDMGYFVTSSSFNKNALEYAKGIPSLSLVNRADLGDMIENLPDNGWQMKFLVSNKV